MSKLWIAAALFCCGLMVSAPVAEAKTAARPAAKHEEPAQIQAKLEAFIAEYLNRCNTSVSACKTKPAVAPRDGKMVATYIEIDPASVETEMFPTQDKHFAYMAKLRYVEHVYESVGNTQDEALSGAFKRVKSRRLTELPRYAQGKWQN